MEPAERAGATILDCPFNLRDPWGNHLEIVAVWEIAFTKADEVFKAWA